jgi:non-specific serine/threonine protein kinase
LAALIDASLVQAMTDEGDEPRFRLLETVREYGLERLAAAGEAEDLAQAHAVTMAAFVAAAEPNLLGPDEVRWQARCAAELGNLRAALSWAIDHDLEMALRMGGSLWAYWAWCQLAEGRRWLTLALSRDGKVAPRVRSRALTTQAALAVLEGDDSELEITQEALELARAAGDLSAEAVALWIRACGVMSRERISDAIPDLDAALQLRSFITSPTDRGWIAYARALRGAVEMILGDPDLGHVDYEAAIQEIREVGSPGLLIMFLGDYAGWLLEANDLPQARIYLTEAMALSARHRCLWQLCSPLVILAIVNAREGEIATAARQLGAIEEILKRSGLELSAHFAQRYERLADLVRLRLSRDDLEALRAEGRTDPIRVMADAGEAFISSAPSQAKRSTGPRCPARSCARCVGQGDRC